MCRFALYLGPTLTLDALVTRPTNSIIHQSFHSHERSEPLNGDGFGVAWYVPEVSEHPGLFRSITPAWNNSNLQRLAAVTRSSCILAHVRAASPGLAVTETNCHPFVRGRFSFMHNGEVGVFKRVRRELVAELTAATYDAMEGNSDSELLFSLFVDRLAEMEVAEPLEAMGAAVEAVFQQVLDSVGGSGGGAPSFLNVAVTDGRRAVVTRFTDAANQAAPSLYVHEGLLYTCEDGMCRMVEPKGHGAVLVCSEPLSDDPGWNPVPRNSLVLVREDRTVQVRPLDVGHQ